MAINNTTVVPKIVAAALIRAYRRQNVYAGRVNNTWRNALNANGDTVIINQPAAVSIGDYTANGTITYANADVGTPQELTISKRKSWSVKFDDLNRAVSVPDLLSESVVEYGRDLAETVDSDVRAAMVSGATAADDVTIDSNANTATVERLKLFEKHRRLDLAHVPRAGRWAICGPYFAELLQRLAMGTERLLASNAERNTMLVNGMLGSFGGFTWYVNTNNADSDYKQSAVTEGGVAKKARSAREVLLFGNDTATAFIDQVRRTERIRLETTFADAVRGLYTYGYKVIHPTRLLKATYTIEDIGQL